MLRKKALTQEALDKEWKRRTRQAKIHINITISPDTKKKILFETMANNFRVNRARIKTKTRLDKYISHEYIES